MLLFKDESPPGPPQRTCHRRSTEYLFDARGSSGGGSLDRIRNKTRHHHSRPYPTTQTPQLGPAADGSSIASTPAAVSPEFSVVSSLGKPEAHAFANCPGESSHQHGRKPPVMPFSLQIDREALVVRARKNHIAMVLTPVVIAELP